MQKAERRLTVDDIINCSICRSMNDKTWTTCCECGASPLVDLEEAAYAEMIKAQENEPDA